MLTHDENNLGDINSTLNLGKKFVQEIVDALNDRFQDLGTFNAAKFFEPRSYDEDLDLRENKTIEWLERLLEKFCSGHYPVASKQLCLSEREEFVEQLFAIGSNKSMLKAWEFCIGGTYERF